MTRQRGAVYRVKGGFGIRWREGEARYRNGGPFPTKTSAREWFADNVRPRLAGGLDAADRTMTLTEFVDRYLRMHATTREPRTVSTLRLRLGYATRAFGDVRLVELERMALAIAEWRQTLPARSRYGIVQALRQVLNAAVRFELIRSNPAARIGRNPQPKPLEIVPFTPEEIAKNLAAELGPQYGPLIVFAAETGLRPCEWIALERGDINAQEGVVVIERTFAGGRAKPYGKTVRSRRRVPLSSRALAAIKDLPPRLDTRLLFPASEGGFLDLSNWQRRSWRPACEAAGFYECCGETMESAGIRGAGLYRCATCKAERPSRRVYDLRHSFATTALAAGIPAYDVARYMGTSLAMLDRTYGHLIRGSEETASAKLDALAARLDQEWAAAEGGSEQQ